MCEMRVEQTREEQIVVAAVNQQSTKLLPRSFEKRDNEQTDTSAVNEQHGIQTTMYHCQALELMKRFH